MKTFARICLLGNLFVFAGCHQGTNPSVPLSPVNPLVGATRVPPPPTGSYVLPDGYSGGGTAGVNDQTRVESPSLEFASASGFNSGRQGSTSLTTASGFTNPAGVEDRQADIQRVGYTAVSPLSSDAQVSPATALQLSGATSPSANLPSTRGMQAIRGMQVVDLTSPGAAKPAIQEESGASTPYQQDAELQTFDLQTSELQWRKPFE